MFGRRRPPRYLRGRRTPRKRLSLIWVIVGILALLFWLVPVYGTPLDFTLGWTPPSLRLSPPPTDTPTPRPTPEHGGRIVFTCTRGSFNHLCLINVDGTDLQQLSTDEISNDYYPSFSPQGNAVLFASNRNGPFDIYLMMFGQ